MHRSWTSLACALAVSGCAHYLEVTSTPPGARVLLDGKETGYVTPAEIKPRSVPGGKHELTLALDGYQQPAPRTVENEVSVGLVTWSLIFWPAGLYNLFHGFTKNTPEQAHFVLQSTSEATVEAPPVDATGESTGPRPPRARIAHPGTKCATMPLRTKDVPEQATFVADDILLAELQSSGFEAIGPSDISAMLGFEKTREVAGCDEASCVTEIGNALGVDYLVSGAVTSVEGSLVLTLKLIDIKNARVLSRASGVADGGAKALPGLLSDSVQEIVARSGL